MSVESQESVKERTKDRVREPRLYNVIMLNDDFTTMEFVVDILISIFHKDEATAQTLMLAVHKNGRAVVGRYTYDIASTKVAQALDRAKTEGFPFRMILEES